MESIERGVIKMSKILCLLSIVYFCTFVKISTNNVGKDRRTY